MPSVTEMFAWLGWETLKDKRGKMVLALFYKIRHNIVAI